MWETLNYRNEISSAFQPSLISLSSSRSKVDISQGKYWSKSNCAVPGSLTVMFRRQQRKQLIIQYSLTTLGKMWVQTRPKYCFFLLFDFHPSTFSLGLSHTDSYWEIEKGKV